MKRYALLFSFLLLVGCKKDEPTKPALPSLGKRDYVWSIDSVDYGNLPSRIQLKSIWGSSPSDVWGLNGDASDVRDCLWHYDGLKWSRASAGTPITDFTGNKAVYAIWGTAQNNIWTVGRKIDQGTLSAFIMQYDGTRWRDVTPSGVVSLQSVLYGLSGTSQNDLWAFGYEYALHYDGSQWAIYRVADSLIVASITKNSKALYASAYSPWGRNVMYIYRFGDGRFEVVDSTGHGQRKFGVWLWARENDLSSFADGVISTSIRSDGNIDGDGWQYVFNTSTPFGSPSVLAWNNVFASGSFNLLYHFNGADWKRLLIEVPARPISPYANLYGIWSDGIQLFVCDTESGTVYHGK